MTRKRIRRGFTFIEILIVMIIIGLLARIAIPHYTDMKRRAIAASIMGDLQTIRVATYTYYTEKSNWPPEYGPGVVPTELVDLLPRDFPFAHPDYDYDFERWDLSGGTPQNPEQESIVALSVTTADARLATQLLKLAGKGYVPFASGNRVTFFISGVSGS
jgi:prepilin-type N-terminal cleavage/methylation domain-containing protein